MIASALAGSNRGINVRQRARGDRGVQPTRLPERVKQRQRAEDDVAGADREQPDRHVDVALEVGVGQLGAFRGAGRSRRVEDHGRVVAGALRHLGQRLGLRQLALERIGLDQQAVDAGVLGARSGACVGEPVPRDQQARLRIRQIEADLPALEQDVHRHDDRADPQHRVVGDGELRHVREHDPDAIPGRDAACPQQAGEPRGELIQPAVGDDDVVDPQRGIDRRHEPPNWSDCRQGCRSCALTPSRSDNPPRCTRSHAPAPSLVLKINRGLIDTYNAPVTDARR